MRLLAAALAAVAVNALASSVVTARLVEGRRYGSAKGPALCLNRNERGNLVGLPIGLSALILAALLGGALALSRSVGSVGAVGLGIAVGGAGANLGDRVARGAVLDYLVVGRWPVFNLGDAAMTVGVLLALISVL